MLQLNTIGLINLSDADTIASNISICNCTQIKDFGLLISQKIIGKLVFKNTFFAKINLTNLQISFNFHMSVS